ncbi:winged helix-turn-helix transcriptional regulator [Mucilaginibacter rubeus]|uniref:Winged helix-turn-helix transcriptional regulator n=2 Tax=Sphingobacteriaceae TaxID=84566 RepID=A0AAE6MKU8_9SPHI|nr:MULTISPECIES: metalloregulator ArsR/SmtB family transcription factor [Mucilaginibacter]PMP66348.1 MAG: transcriptional regulator [Mucilaginibacter sp.]HEK21102.1 ArsR family transcriptional regulator [Bacteroidota bacterium]NHA05658.1 winged helix-turn-helix transcriptional regulator [Mucilaginibacter inviolabilis]QEM07026.1 winged helix-turn-helix transcriptional regulator [Mucilaginibacter rubeus]QTE43831.1 winged helix-turn-helix transcriptional regulator [Mucilaginibacter rubeus]
MEMSTCKRIFADSGQIKNCKETIKENQQEFSALSAALALAGNEVRLKIFFLLHQEKELCPCDLSNILEMTIPAISQHLRKLKDGGLIQFRKSGQTIFYSICPPHLPLLQPLFNLINQPLSTIKA